MSTNTKTANIGYYEVGTIFTVNVDFVKNLGPATATGVEVAVTIPDGIIYSTSGLSQGSYNDITDIWSVGSLTPGQTVSGTFSFEVTDDCEGPYSIDFDVSTSAGCDNCLQNNKLCIVTNGIPCCEVSGCSNEAIGTITTATYTVDASADSTLLLDATSNAVAITLPDPAAVYNSDTGKSQKFTFKAINVDNAVTMQTPTGVIVNDNTAGATDTHTLSTEGDAVSIVSNGTNYYIVSKA